MGAFSCVTVFCLGIRNYSDSVLPLLTNEYTFIPAKCQGKLTKYMGGNLGWICILSRWSFLLLFFCSGGVTKIFLGSCNKKLDKLWKSESLGPGTGFTLYTRLEFTRLTTKAITIS